MSARTPARAPGRRRWRLPRVGLHLRVAVLLALAILPVGAIGVVEALQTARETTRLARTELVNRTRLAAEEGRVALTAAFGALEGLAVLLPTGSGRACTRTLGAFVGSDPRYAFAAFIRPDGAIACTSRSDGARPAFLEAPDTWSPQEAPRSSVQLSAHDPVLDAVVLNALRSVYRDGEHAGTLMLSVPVTLLQTLTRATEEGDDFRLALLDWRGNIFAEGAQDLGDPDWSPAELNLRGSRGLNEQIVTGPSRAGERRSYAVVPIYAGDIHALGSWSQSNLERAATWRAVLAVLYPAAMAALAFAVAWLAVHWLAVRHIAHLRGVMGTFEGGRRDVRARQLEGAAPELSDLGAAFDRMADTIERDEQALQRAVEEKTALIREVYHRVKNNLQIVISMMNVQMRQATSEEERAVLARLQERVMGLAAVHQRLYLANDLTRVRCDELLTEIVAMLCRSASGPGGVSVERRLMALELGPDEAIPLALFATETVTNALKHGAEDESAALAVVLEEAGEGRVRFMVANRVPKGRKAARKDNGALDSGVGSRLIEAFARQLDGTLESGREGGFYHVSLTFPRPDRDRRPDTALQAAK